MDKNISFTLKVWRQKYPGRYFILGNAGYLE